MSDCIFCKIINGEIKSNKVYEDDHVIAFNDLHPQAPTHILIVPRSHIASLNDIHDLNHALVGRMTHAAVKIAKEKEFADDGYRLVLNCNKDGGQTVFHIHMHLLAGRQMHWPPG